MITLVEQSGGPARFTPFASSPAKGRKKSTHAAVSSHQFGWELELLIDDDVRQAQVCRSREEIEATADRWKAALYEKGWGVRANRGDRNS